MSSSRGLRGSALEELINISNEKYRAQGLALMQKVPTPITPVEIDGQGHITLAYFDQKSTIDYVGVVQGIPVCFDAKECASETSFPLANVHEHQMEFMRDFEKQDGVAFFLICFTKLDRYYYCPYREMEKYWERAKDGGRKSVNLSEFTEGWEVCPKGVIPIHYLEALKSDLESRG